METFPHSQAFSDREIRINPSAVFNCKISPEGIIDYANHQFCEVSGYEEFELIGESMDILRHPDMPEIFFHVLLDRLQKKEPMRLFARFLAKDKRFFWLMIDFETKVDEEGNIVAHYSNSVGASQYAIHKISSLHKILSKIEHKTGNTEASKRYLIGFLEERNMNYNQYVEELSISHPEYESSYGREQTITQRIPVTEEKNQAKQINRFNYNENFDLSSRGFNQENPPQKKKRSILKRVFGK